MNSGLYINNVVTTYKSVCIVLNEIDSEPDPSIEIEYYRHLFSPYYHNAKLNMHELLVELDLYNKNISIEDLIEFNVINMAMLGEIKAQIDIPIETVAEEFEMKTLFAYAFAINVLESQVKRPCHLREVDKNMIKAKLFANLRKINIIRPTLFAKLFVLDANSFIDAMKFTCSSNLMIFMHNAFKQNLSVDKTLFGIVLKKFLEKVEEINTTFQHMH